MLVKLTQGKTVKVGALFAKNSVFSVTLFLHKQLARKKRSFCKQI
jgi:hypothetical protein